MTASRFFRFTLRTTNVDAARDFYQRVLPEGAAALDIVKLHEQAVARGAKPHWLGMIEVADVERAAAAFIERGATSLGPRWVNPQGLEAAVLRDPFGAVVSVAKPAQEGPLTGTAPNPVWFLLNTPDVARAQRAYGELFGWHFGEPSDLGPLGVLHPFAFEPKAAPVGAMMSTEGRPNVHPHWLFHFQVPAIQPAVETVKERGGVVVGTFALPSGESLAVCDDAQGATFTLRSNGT